MTDLASLTEGEFWPLIEQAKERVLTNDLAALEMLIIDGLPPDEMQAAAWALVQRVRGLKGDLARLEQARVAWQKEALSASGDPEIPSSQRVVLVRDRELVARLERQHPGFTVTKVVAGLHRAETTKC